MDGLRELGVDVWFSLGDRDLAIGIERARRLADGARLTEALAELGAALGVSARVLPMSDEPVRTWVRRRAHWTPFQEFMIRDGAAGPVAGHAVSRHRRGPPDPRDPRRDRRRRARSSSARPTP